MYKSSLPKKFKLPGQVPTPDEMSQGELIVNTADSKLYTLDYAGAVQLIATPAVQQIDTITSLDLSAFEHLSTNIGNIIVGLGGGTDSTTGGRWGSMRPGPDGYILVADSTQPSGLNWALFSFVVAADTTTPAFTMQGTAGQTAPIAQALNSAGDVQFSVDPNGWLTIGGAIADGTTVIATYGNNNAHTGELIQIAHDTTTNQNITKYAFHGQILPTVNTGCTEAGTSGGVLIDALHKGLSSGVLTTIAGITVNYGNQFSGNCNGVTTYNYGLLLQPYNQNGVIQAQYDLYIAAPNNGTSPGSLVEHYSIFQQDSSAQNYLGGQLSIGLLSNDAGLVVSSTTSNTQLHIDYTYNVIDPQEIDHTGFQIDLYKNFIGGPSDSGSLNGIINNTIITGRGSLTTLINHEASYGAILSAAGNIDTVYGVRLNPQFTECTVSNLYDLYISAPTGSGTYDGITNHYAIYQADANASNVFNGLIIASGNAHWTTSSWSKTLQIISGCAIELVGGGGTSFGMGATGTSSYRFYTTTEGATGDSAHNFETVDCQGNVAFTANVSTANINTGALVATSVSTPSLGVGGFTRECAATVETSIVGTALQVVQTSTSGAAVGLNVAVTGINSSDRNLAFSATATGSGTSNIAGEFTCGTGVNDYAVYIAGKVLVAGNSDSIQFIIQGNTSQINNSLQEWQTSGGSALLKVDPAGHLVSHSGLSGTLAATAGPGAGTSPTVGVTGSDQGGLVTVTTGSAPSAGDGVVTIAFGVAYGAAPSAVVITPANAATAALSGNGAVYVNSANTTTAHFTLDVGSTALADTTTYKWYYLVIG